MSEHQSSYRQIMKATSLFGGVQVFNIIIAIIRSKFIAIFLGPAGMGVAGLLTATTTLIGGLTNFGLGTSAVRDVASASASGNKIRIAVIIGVFRRLVWITGLLGMILTLLLAPWLSQITFGNKDYTIAFAFVSITLLFNQLTSERLVILQGMRKTQLLANANLLGSFIGLLVIIPVYYYFKLAGIVPGIIIASSISFVLAWFFSQKIEVEDIYISKVRTIAEGKKMLFLGFMVSISGLVTLGASYLVRIFINYSGGVEQVGLYNAGFALTNTYVGLVFSAMATDYFPRLSANAHDNAFCTKTINEQAEIAILLLAPLIIIFLIFIQWAVILLYSEKFMGIETMIHWAALGMFFRAASWSISFVFLAKGSAKLFFWNELIANVYILLINILGYHFYGLTGIGIAFLVGYVLYLIQVFLISKLKYSFSFSNSFIKNFLIQITLSIGCFIIISMVATPYNYIFGVLILISSLLASYIELNKRIDIVSLLAKFKKAK